MNKKTQELTGFSQLYGYLVFPLTLLSCLLLASYAIDQGVAGSSIIGACSGIAIVVIFLSERWIPFRAEWRNSHDDIVTDILHSMINSYGFRELCKIALLALMLPIMTAVVEKLGSPLWPYQWPLFLQVIWAALWAEFGYYWMHRLCHENAFFWRFHAVHHSPKRLYWLNAGRDHPLGVLLFYVAGALPLIILGAPAEVLVYFFVLEAVHGLFQHSNIQLRLGPLNYLFSMAELHRWHHSQVVKEANHNYGLNLIVWDIIFRSRYLPDLNGPKEIGVGGFKAFPQRFWQQMWVPFRWKRLQKTSE